MSNTAVRYGKRTAARLRAIRLRAAEWRRRARRALTFAVVAAGVASAPSWANAQMGQMGMAQTGGIVNRAVSGLRGLNENGPGWMYYGINAADRGLGYNGSYMTLGGFVPYAEDDLGGFWAADLRGHLSEYGGFFSNVGAVRKQFIGGSLLGVGVYWDYDGDANQYPVMGMEGAQFGQFGHSYNQVGISGEWLTDFGNLRSNGYIPVGSTAYVAGAPGSPFYQNYLMCQYGLDAALSGADLEVGAYVPALADWAGMISVGGYALGNSRYDWQVGPESGQEVVPWFGGVYTRLDMTFVENWDFSLQANNDSFFDWTGFARLTYRMGGSRRRNVPDQVEQPMMRNEHIVRAHQTPIMALNANNSNQPWRVIHVDNSATPVGNGSAEAPFTNIVNANAAATNPWDIVLVARGSSRVNLDSASANFGTVTNAYAGTFSPLAANQYFIGEGSPFYVPTGNCGPINIGGSGAVRPVLTNPTGPSINLSNGLQTNNFDIVNSAVGISGSGDMSGAGSGRPSFARDIDIYRTDPLATGRGIEISGATGTAVFRDVNVGKLVTLPDGTTEDWTMTDGSVVVAGGAATVDFANGSIVNTQNHILQVTDTLGGEVALTANPSQPFVETGDGILVSNASGDVTVKNKTPGMPAALIDSQQDGIKVVNSSGSQTFNDIVVGAAGGSGYAGVNLQGNSGTSNFNNLDITTVDSVGFLAANDNAVNVTGNSSVDTTGATAVLTNNVADANINFRQVASTNSNAEGVYLKNTDGLFTVSDGVSIANAKTHGFRVENSADLEVNIPSLTAVSAAGLDGIRLLNNNQTSGASMAFDRVQVSTGDRSTPRLGGRGVVVQSTGPDPHGLVTINDGTVDAFGGASLDINNADVAIKLTSAVSDTSAGNGLNVVNSSGSVEVAETFVISPTGNGINLVDNVPGFVADFGTTSVTGIDNGAVGVNITNSTDPVPDTYTSFDSLQIETVNGTGILTKNGGTVNFNSPATVTANGGPALNLENTTGTTNNVAGSGFTFLNINSTASSSSGIRLHNLNSDFRATGVTNITSASGRSISITDNQTPPGVYAIDFNEVNIASRLNTGVFVEGINGTVQFASLNIDNGNGVAGPAVRVQNTTNPFDPTGPGSGVVSINGGLISNTFGNGVEVSNGLANIINTTIDGSTGNAVLLTAGSGQQTTALVQGSSLTGSALNGVRIEAGGTGIVNATVLNTLIDAVFDPISAVNFAATSDISLNATGNFGAGGPPGAGTITLNNAAGGLLIIDQASTAALNAANNGAGVVPVGVISFGGNTPTPPSP